ncbi:MAG: RNA-binding S4 domain-containing protein [FCB group bacterium]|nr:RNA-binding S4 domain-containing protein [FCB group bacterium]
MRIDDFLSTVGIIKRRTVAKEMAQNGLIIVNQNKAKPAYQVKVSDIIQIKGKNPRVLEVLDIPRGSVSKEKRPNYFKLLV